MATSSLRGFNPLSLARSFEQVLERSRLRPAARLVAHEHGDDRSEPRPGVFLDEAVPDPALIRERALRHRRIAGALVLEQEIHELATAQLGREQEVAVLIGEPGIDERAALVVQRLPHDRLADGGRHQLAQERCGACRRFERRFEQGIVRARRHERTRMQPRTMPTHPPRTTGPHVRIVRLPDAPVRIPANRPDKQPP